MARSESQTLLIWTIIFLILLLISIVVNVVFYNKYTGTISQIADATKKYDESQREVNNLKTEGVDLRALIGYSDPAIQVADVKAAFEAEVAVAATGVPQSVTSYKVAMEQLTNSYKKQVADNLSMTKQNLDLQNLVDKQNEKEEKLKNELMAKVNDANQQLNNAQDQFTQLEGEMRKQVNDLNEQLTQTEKDTRTAIDEANKRRKTEEDSRQKVMGINENLTNLVAQYTSPIVTYQDAKIIWVSADSKTARINKGYADGIISRMAVSIYPPDVKDVPITSNKGKAEVTRILDNNTSEVHITEDVWLDPIMVGDMIYSPIWTPGQKTHFALSCGLDADGNNASDVLFIKQVIEMNGGIVDAYIDDQTGGFITDKEGNRVREILIRDGNNEQIKEGSGITKDTTYYIITNKVDPKKQQDISMSGNLLEKRSKMEADAKLYNVKFLTVQELFNLMGFRLPTEKVGFGKNNRNGNNINLVPDAAKAKMSDNVFRNFENPDAAPTTNGMAPVSPLFNQRKIGTVEGSASPLFKKRTPLVSDENDNN
ncbi:MAG: hypothetical protein LBT05_04970 [Planctomycetaceae bacterium]|jgi:biopolymer transport protein ExbB/TolQ|nr:hypothetical protein [Planctomycetaceae bacterium]